VLTGRSRLATARAERAAIWRERNFDYLVSGVFEPNLLTLTGPENCLVFLASGFFLPRNSTIWFTDWNLAQGGLKKMSDPRYPIGKFNGQPAANDAERQKFLRDIEETPSRLKAAVQGLSPQQLDTPYRDGGWTVRQLAHHVPDSHINAYIRFKLALTEDQPTIKPYREERWAELADTKGTPVEVSLGILDLVHQRWMVLLRSLQPEDWKRTMNHPEAGVMTLDKTLALYSWHGRHHVAHVAALRDRMGW
jgi:uncharacterized damage-inducible protein DinB